MKHFKSILTVLTIVFVALLTLNIVLLAQPKSNSASYTDSSLALVNKAHSVNPSSNSMVSVFDYKSSSYFVKDKNVKLTKTTIKALNKMLDDFYDETGLKTINIISGYRTKETQQEIYDGYVESDGKEYAKNYVQTPGNSEHHTGYAVDLGLFFSEDLTSGTFTGDGEYSWITENAWKYGFILRYPESKSDLTGISYEPWHFRYVGLPHSKYITENDLCLEEYIKLLHSYSEDNMLKIKSNGTTYGVLFSKSDLTNVDKGEFVSSSCDNAGGYIITCIL